MGKLTNLNNLNKLSKALDARCKELVNEEKARALAEEQALQAEINVTKDMFGGKSIRYVTQAEYDTLTEEEKDSSEITYFITDAVDLSHEHENKEFLDNLAARNISIGNKSQLFDGVNDLVYSIEDMGVASVEHNHDDRYYTETEIDGKISNKQDKTDNTLNTEDKTIVGAINELESEVFDIAANVISMDAYKADKSELFSGDYNDLINIPCGDTREYETINCPIIFDGNLTDKVVVGPEDDSSMESVFPSLVKVADVAPIINLPVNEGHEVIDEMVKNGDLIIKSCVVVSGGEKYVCEQGYIYQGYTWETEETNDSYIGIYDDNQTLIAALVYEECIIDEYYYKFTVTPGIWYTVDIHAEDSTVVDYVESYSITYLTGGEFKKISREFVDYLPGLNVEGKDFTVSIMNMGNQQDGVLQVAKGGAEIFNDYEGNAATGRYSHAEGSETMASGNYSHAEGAGTKAIDAGAHAEGNGSIASGVSSHAEGLRTKATGDGSHAEGYETKAFGSRSHTEGVFTEVSKMASDGKNTTYAGHAEGQNTKVTAQYAGHAEGYHTISASNYQHVQGKFNIEDAANTYAHIVGNGTSTSDRKNAHTLDWNGNAWFQGNISIDGTPTNDKDLTTKLYVDNNIPIRISDLENDSNFANKEDLKTLDALTLNGYSLWVGTTAELEAITERDPNTLYFEIDDGTGEEVVQVNIVNGVLQLTADKYQKTNMLDGAEIVFPTVNRFTEIHLYFTAGSNMNINLPDNCKWRVEPNIEEGNSYEIVATYNTIEWLVNVIVYS